MSGMSSDHNSLPASVIESSLQECFIRFGIEPCVVNRAESPYLLSQSVLYEVTLTLTAALVFPATFTGTGHEVELWSRPLVFIFDPEENTLVSRGSI